MACKLKDLIERLIRTIAVVIAIPVERENQLLREEVLRHAKIEVGPRIEIGIETEIEIDRETDREIDPEIDRAIDREIETEGNISQFLFSNFTENYCLKEYRNDFKTSYIAFISVKDASLSKAMIAEFMLIV